MESLKPIWQAKAVVPVRRPSSEAPCCIEGRRRTTAYAYHTERQKLSKTMTAGGILDGSDRRGDVRVSLG